MQAKRAVNSVLAFLLCACGVYLLVCMFMCALVCAWPKVLGIYACEDA